MNKVLLLKKRKRRSHLFPLTWLPSLKLDEKHETDSGAGEHLKTVEKGKERSTADTLSCPWEIGECDNFPLTHRPSEFSGIGSFLLECLPGAMSGWVATAGTIRLSPARPSKLPGTLPLLSPLLSGSVTLSVVPDLAPAGEP